MANKDFGVKKIELIGSSGTPNLTSPNNLNLNAVTVAISTDVTIGGKVQSNVIVGTGYSVGIGSTQPSQSLDVSGTIRATNFVTSNGSPIGSGDTANVRSSTLTVSGVSTFSGSYLYANNISLSTGYALYVSNTGGSYHQLGGTTQDLLLFKSRGVGPISNISINILNDTLGIGGGSDESVFKVYGDGGLRSYYHTISGGFAIQSERFSVTGGDSSGATPTEVVMKVGSGVTAYGNAGIVSATSFYANNFYGTFNGNLTGSITNATNLTGGTANASSLNVSGIATISAGRIQADASANLRFGNLPAGSGSGRNIAIGDQVLASLSGGQGRNIGIGELSYYDTTTGQYNIGIGERSGQKVSTGSYNVILGAYDGNSGNLDIRTSSRNVVIADGEGNIRQYINSSGNVGIKTTVVTEALTVAGVVSATSFYGTLNASQLTGTLPAIDGSALINVVGSGSGVVIQDDATPVGTAGTINFGSNISVSFASGIATVSGASSVSEATTAYGLAGTPNIYAGITTVDYLRAGSYSDINSAVIIGRDPASSDPGNINISNKDLQLCARGIDFGSRGNIIFYRREAFLNKSEIATLYSDTGNLSIDGSLTSGGNSDNSFNANVKVGTAITLSNSGHINATGVITATSFYGSGANLTSLPAGQLTGSLPAIDGSALLNVTAAGTGVAVKDDGSTVGSATTIDFGTGLDVAFSGGVATITASGGSLQSRTIVTGVTTSIANNGIGNTNITGFKSYALMKVGLSTAGWLRLYTDSASRAADASRSVGIDPAPGSGVIAEVVTTGISTTQIISPFVMGGNLDNPADTTIYAAITNLSGSTQAITANLTILQLEA